ncbi:hypothetical protein [Aureivirga marina]|uniref:hypothetical protein n=1 Tax=Aureivirga marina TaxID=1182451 RepID=UPI0018C9DDE0|nr:hypothetical protein [Aureivirga marina]
MERISYMTAKVFFLFEPTQNETPLLEEKNSSKMKNDFNNDGFIHSNLNLDLQQISVEDKRKNDISYPSSFSSQIETNKVNTDKFYDRLITLEWHVSSHDKDNAVLLPIIKGENVVIQPISDTHYFVPSFVEVKNDGTDDLLQNFVAIPKALN